MKYSYSLAIIILASELVCTSASADVMHDRACFWIFKKSTLTGEARPERVLRSLGVREGTDFYGHKNKSLEVVHSKSSAVSILLSKFQKRWPKIQLFYSVEMANVGSVNALMRMGQHVAYVQIPLSMLADYFLLEWHIVRLNSNLKKVEKLLQEPVDFNVSQMTSMGFKLEIKGYKNRPIDPQLAWMWRRHQRHQFSFTFTNTKADLFFSENNLGLSMGREIFLADSLLLSEDKNFKAFLAHEIVHSTNSVRFEKYGDPSGQISFHAGLHNTLGFFQDPNMPPVYKRAFSTDEMEAWLITQKLNPEVATETGVSYQEFLHNQITWLTELRRILPGQLIEHEYSWAPLAAASTGSVYVAVPNHSAEEVGSSFKFVVFAGAPDEVVIVIPRAQGKVEELGAEVYLLNAIDRRLMQLKNRARLAEAPR